MGSWLEQVLYLTGWDEASCHKDCQLPSSTGLWHRQWAGLSGGSRAVGKAPVSGSESRLPELCPVLEFLLQPSASRLPNRVWSVSDNCCPPFFSPFLRVWLVLWMLLGEMNTSNEDSNPQNKTTSNLRTNQEKHQKRAEGSGQGLY